MLDSTVECAPQVGGQKVRSMGTGRYTLTFPYSWLICSMVNEGKCTVGRYYIIPDIDPKGKGERETGWGQFLALKADWRPHFKWPRCMKMSLKKDVTGYVGFAFVMFVMRIQWSNRNFHRTEAICWNLKWIAWFQLIKLFMFFHLEPLTWGRSPFPPTLTCLFFPIGWFNHHLSTWVTKKTYPFQVRQPRGWMG